MRREHDSLSIWFFIGVLLLVYGVLILGYGLLTLGEPAPQRVLAELHADVWWGAFLVVLGLGYTIRFRPGRTSQ
jgi:hypothetical protein